MSENHPVGFVRFWERFSKWLRGVLYVLFKISERIFCGYRFGKIFVVTLCVVTINVTLKWWAIALTSREWRYLAIYEGFVRNMFFVQFNSMNNWFLTGYVYLVQYFFCWFVLSVLEIITHIRKSSTSIFHRHFVQATKTSRYTPHPDSTPQNPSSASESCCQMRYIA